MASEQKVSRERILQGAEEILESGHYAHLTVDALARALRMSKSTLYKYFPSKEEVVVALVKGACDRADAEISAALASEDAETRLSELAAALGRFGQRLPRAVVVESAKIPEACNARLRQTQETFSDAASTVILSGSTSGEFGGVDGPVAAVAFVAAAEAVLVDRPEADDQRVTQLMQLFLPGLKG